MTGCLLLVALLVPQADPGAIVKAWEVREASLTSAEVSWKAVRSSRDRSFGFENPDDAGQPSMLRISGRQIRQDGERLTAVMRDGRTRPAESDPEKTRRQFRHVLLEERLAGIQAAPFVETISSVATIGGQGAGRRFGSLEQLQFDVPIWCARPLVLFPGKSVIVDEPGSARQTHYVCSSANLPAGQSRTVWVEPAAPYRILRVIQVDPDRGTTQADLQYEAPDEFFSSTWTVQQLNSAGQPLDFLKAERTSVSINPVIDKAVFQLPLQTTSDDAAALSQTGLTLRRLARTIVDASWLVLAILWGIVAIFLVRSRQQSKSAGQEARLSKRGKRLAVVAALATPVIAVLPMLPLCDPSMHEAYQRLEAIHRKAESSEESSPAEAKAVREESLQELKNLSAELRQAGHRRAGIWASIQKPDPQDESAWRDILRVADGELPALIRSTARNDARERAVMLTLEKVDDHLAGVHPYMPPPKPVLIQTGLESSKKPDVLTQTSRSAIILTLEIGALVSVWWIWRARQRRRSVIQHD